MEFSSFVIRYEYVINYNLYTLQPYRLHKYAINTILYYYDIKYELFESTFGYQFYGNLIAKRVVHESKSIEKFALFSQEIYFDFFRFPFCFFTHELLPWSAYFPFTFSKINRLYTTSSSRHGI